jgi:DNA-binding NtrC family response regulator
MALVMIVDDEVHVRQILKRWIGGAGYDLVEAESAANALEVMAATPADVVFCDVQMPGGHDGLWLTGELRRRYPLAAVVLATGVSTVPPNISMQAGVLAYLVKPFQRTALLAALETAIAWNTKTRASGAKPEDTGDLLTTWLASLEDL